MTGAGVSGESGQAPVLIAVLEKWKDLGSVAHLVPSVAGNIARGEIMRFNHVHVLVRSKVGTVILNVKDMSGRHPLVTAVGCGS